MGARTRRRAGGPVRLTAARIPRLHLVTDDGVLAEPDFVRRAREVLQVCGGDVALHLRGHATPARRLHALSEALRGARRIVNDRIDIVLASDAEGVQLGVRSLPIADARALLGAERLIGYSAHDPAEARTAAHAGADFVILGTVWPSASHPAALPSGPATLHDAVRAGDIGGRIVPVLAIGGVTPVLVAEALAAGAHGVAVLAGVW
ncbi:MAG: thiamine phosphate synthase, partial [Longimicrobiales bacterium]